MALKPGVSAKNPSLNGYNVTSRVVCFPRFKASLMIPVSIFASGNNKFNRVDFPTPYCPIMTYKPESIKCLILSISDSLLFKVTTV